MTMSVQLPYDSDRLAKRALSLSTLIKEGPPDIYKLPLTASKEACFNRYQIGSVPDHEKPEKILLLLGAVGVGKSMMINGLANFVLGVEFGDHFRFKVVVDEDPTNTINIYSFYSTQLSYTLTVIDTPGFGGTEGITRDNGIVKNLKKLFGGHDCNGIDGLHGIGIVVQSSVGLLTQTQIYTIRMMLSMFGKDMRDNIFLMITSADPNPPPVIDACKNAGIPFTHYYKFDNSAIFESNGPHSLTSWLWEIGCSSFAQFRSHFDKIRIKSLTMTREVLEEKSQLEMLASRLLTQDSHKMNDLISRVQMSNEKLMKIILKPNPLTDTMFLKLLIEYENWTLSTGYIDRVEQCRAFLKEAEILKASCANMK